MMKVIILARRGEVLYKVTELHKLNNFFQNKKLPSTLYKSLI